MGAGGGGGGGVEFNFNFHTLASQFSPLHTYTVGLQVAIMTSEGGS